MVQAAAKLWTRFTNNREHTEVCGQRKRWLLRKKGACQRTSKPTCSEGRRELRQAQGWGVGGGPRERLLNSVLVESSPQRSHPMTTHTSPSHLHPSSSPWDPLAPCRAGCTRAALEPGRLEQALFPSEHCQGYCCDYGLMALIRGGARWLPSLTNSFTHKGNLPVYIPKLSWVMDEGPAQHLTEK